MPRILSEQEFNALRDHVLASAPEGLDETSFNRIIKPAMEQALGEAENTPPSPEGSALYRAAAGAWSQINPVNAVKGIAAMASSGPPQSATDAMLGPVGRLGKAVIVDPAIDQFRQAYKAFREGRYSEAVGHGAAGVVPVVGPAAANIGTRMGETGDIARGIGEGAGLAATAVLGPKAPEVAETAALKTGSGLATGAERIINSNVKPPPSLVGRNPTINIPRVILDEGLSPGFKGAHQGAQVSKNLANEVTALADADTALGKKYSLDPVKQRVEAVRDKYKLNPAGDSDVSAAQGVIDELMGNPNYSRDVTQTMMTPIQSAILGSNGQPISTMKPVTTVVGRETIPQDASSINTMKRSIYEENPKAYGERKGARIQAEKAEGSALKSILDENVDGVQDINARNAGIITARKALNKMGVREASKYPFGLMDLGAAAAASGVHLAAGNPLMTAITLAPVLLKHPTTAFPIARGVDSLANTATALAPAAKAATAAGVAGSLVDSSRRKLTLDEAKAAYEKYLAAQQQ